MRPPCVGDCVSSQFLEPRESRNIYLTKTEKAAAIHAVHETIIRAPITIKEACQDMFLHWGLVPPEAQDLIIAIDVDEVFDGVNSDSVNAAWENAPLGVRRRL